MTTNREMGGMPLPEAPATETKAKTEAKPKAPAKPKAEAKPKVSLENMTLEEKKKADIEAKKEKALGTATLRDSKLKEKLEEVANFVPMRVRAIDVGFAGGYRREPGEVFMIRDSSLFSAIWMEEVEEEE